MAHNSASKGPIGVGYFIESLGPGGSERQLVELAHRLDPDRFRPRVLVWHPRLFFGPAMPGCSVPVRRYTRRGRLDVTPALVAAGWLRSGAIRIAHGFLDTGALYAALGRRLARRGAVVVSHRTEWPRKMTRVGRIHKRWSHRAADVVLANSWAGAAQLTRFLGDGRRIETIPNGVDVVRFRPVDGTERRRLRAALGWPTDRLVLLTVGRLCEAKDHVTLMTALAGLEGLDGALVCWIGDQPRTYTERLERALQESGLRSRVLLREPMPDIEVAYQACDALVLSSREEGTPNVVLEAMACGRPVLATDVGDVARYVREGVTGWVVPAEDPHALRAGLARVIRSTSGERARVGANGRGRLLELGLDVESVVQRHEELYEGLVLEGAW